MRPGVTFAEIDLDRRGRIIEDAGWGPGVHAPPGAPDRARQDHEPGDVSSPRMTSRCSPGRCFSIEPGIYLPGDMGVRIEDLGHRDGGRLRGARTATPRASPSWPDGRGDDKGDGSDKGDRVNCHEPFMTVDPVTFVIVYQAPSKNGPEPIGSGPTRHTRPNELVDGDLGDVGSSPAAWGRSRR